MIAPFIAAVLAALALTLAFSAPASAQLPSFCDQYPDDDICIGPVDEADEDGDNDLGPGGNGGNFGDGNGLGGGDFESNNGGDGDGSLPFTGYPLTTLILLLLALLVAGLAVRSYVAIRNRLRGSSPAG